MIFGRRTDYVLGNAEEENRRHPRSFHPAASRARVHPGRAARTAAVHDPQAHRGGPSAERMWVEVTARDDAGYIGVLTNQPAEITSIDAGDEIRFGPEHVIMLTEDWPLLEKNVLVSLRSDDDDVRPGYLYREAPDNDQDSGWRALVGDETDDETADPDSVLVQNLGYLLNRWPELRPVFETDPENAEWRWDAAGNAYTRLTDRAD